MAFWDDGVQLHDLNPFSEGHVLGSARRDSRKEPPGSQPADPRNFMYPGAERDPVTHDLVYGLDVYNRDTRDIAGQYGGALRGMGQGLYDYGGRVAGMGESALGADSDRLTYDPTLGAVRGNVGMIDDAGATLLGLAQAPNGESVAEAQLKRGVAEAANQNLALAASGRGLGGGAAARRAAMSQNAQLFGRMNPELAALRAQETQADLQRRAAAASAAAGAGAQGAQANLGLGGYVTGSRGQAEGLATERGLGLINQGIGAAGAGANAVGQGGALGLQGQGLVGQANAAALQGGIAAEANKTTRRGQDRGLQGSESQAEAQQRGALIGLIGSGLGSVATMGAGGAVGGAAPAVSDRAAKKDIEPVEVRASGTPSMADVFRRERYAPETTELSGEEEDAFQRWARANKVRDVDSLDSHYDYRGFWKDTGGASIRGGVDHFPDTFKQHGHPTFSRDSRYSQGSGDGGVWFGDTFVAPPDYGAATEYPTPRQPTMPTPAAAEETISQTPAYSFSYKEPERHGEGQRVGVMAQDLERTPAGRRAVVRSPDGKRAVDPGELSTINTAALFGIQKRQDKLEEQLDEWRKMFPALTPPDTDALDESYAAERAYRP